METTKTMETSLRECVLAVFSVQDGQHVVPAVAVVALGMLCAASLVNLWRQWQLSYHLRLWVEYLFTSVPSIEHLVPLDDAITRDDGVKGGPVAEMVLVDPARPSVLNCFDPSTRQKLGEVKNMTAEDVHEMLVKAKEAQQEWRKTTFAQRRLVLRTMQKYICSHIEDICRVSARESGKPKVDAVVGEIITTCEKIRTVVALGELWLLPDYRPTGPMMMHKTAWVEFVPLGIIAPIAPWNYPFHNVMNHVISGLMAGNAVVGKVSEHASWSATYFGSIVQAALEVNGHSPHLAQIVTGMAPAGQALVSDPLVDKIIFTGSTPIGRKVMEAASKNLTPVILELGGKDALVVMDDVNVDSVLPWIMRGCFQNSGQNCVGVERVLVYESVHDELIDKIVPRVKSLRQGIPLVACGADGNVDCGSMIMPQQLDIVQNLVDDAVSKGATLHCGGKKSEELEGQFFEPTVLSGVTPDMQIFHEEVFGPVMTIVKVDGDSDSECVRLVNDCAFGLGSSVFTGNPRRGLAVGQRFSTGMLTVNDYASNYLVQSLPFGGVKESGFGRFAGIEGLRALCLERSIVVDALYGVKTVIPKPIDYPIDTKKGFPFAEALVQLFYSESLVAKMLGIVGLVKNG